MSFSNNIGEPREIVHKFGDVSVSPWHTANQMDERGGRKYGKTLRLGDGSEGDYICTACLHTHTHYPCIEAGDEVVARCEACGTLEHIERIDPEAAGDESATGSLPGAPAVSTSPEVL